MTALLVALLVFATAITCVALGVFGAYFAVTGLLAALNPSRPRSAVVATLVPTPSQATGD